MSDLVNSKEIKPWYREPWAWLVAAPIILVLIACSITVTIAIWFADDRVSDNYYQEGRMLAQDFTSDEYAKSIGVVANTHFYPQRNTVIVDLSANKAATLDEVVELTLLISHPAEQAKDIELLLKPSSRDKFRADLPTQLTGRWYLRVQGLNIDAKELWRLHGEINFDQQTVVDLVPK